MTQPRRGRRPSRFARPTFTAEEMETAIKVAMYSKQVYNWVVSEARAFNIDLSGEDGKKFYEDTARKVATTLLLS